MAVYTPVPDDDFRQLLARYAIGAFVSAKPISEGVSNTNYLLTTTQGRYIFTIYEKLINTADLPFFLGLMEHLAGRGIPCPLPVHDASGDVLQEVRGKRAAITSFLEGRAFMNPQSVHCHELGRLLARFHTASESFSLRRDNDYTPAILWQQYRPMVEATPMGKEVVAAAEEILSRWPSGLPSGVIHGDPFPDNVFFEGEKACGIIDFYFACNDAFAYELAIALNSWCFEHHVEFNITKARHLLQGYNEMRPLAEAERDALPVLAAGVALRVLITRLRDWLNQPEGAIVVPHNPEDYLHRLRFHRQVRGVGEYGL